MKKYPTIQVMTLALSEKDYKLVLEQLKHKVLTGIKRRYLFHRKDERSPDNLTPAHIIKAMKDYKIQIANMEPLGASSAIGKTTRQYVHFSSLCADDKFCLAVDIMDAVIAYKDEG